MIRFLPHAVSSALQRENAVHAWAGTLEALELLPRQHPTPQSFLAEFLAGPAGRTFVGAVGSLAPGSAVLDVGAGLGFSSIFLASRGHRVWVIEPSPELCRYVERAADFYRLPLMIFNVTGEGLGRLPARGFDACVFNASLHHCDDPDIALANCHALLRPGGRIFLLNEPQLPRYRSRAWFQRQLERDPERMGHYGGNEHTYHRHEYLAMLRRAGFRDVRDSIASRYRHPGPYLADLRARGVRPLGILSRRLYYHLLEGLNAERPGGRVCLGLLKWLSLVQADFTATKGPDTQAVTAA